MSKYPVQYQSSSKGAVDIESMATPHLANAYKKLMPASVESELAVGQAFYIGRELKERGCTQDAEGRWIFPPKEGA